MELVKSEPKSKLLRFDKTLVERVNKAKGMKQMQSGNRYSDNDFYTELIDEGLKKFES